MRKLGRNDPCPCGSGRKYKRCCLGHEAERDAFAHALQAVALPLLQDVARYAERGAAKSLPAIAQSEFPFWRGPLTPERGARAVDFLIFDYKLPHYGHSALRQFTIERGPSLSEEQRALLVAWGEARTKLYRVAGWSAGFVQCVELLTDADRRVEVWPLGEPGEAIEDGAPVAVRALPGAGKYMCIGRPARFGTRSAQEVATAVKARHLDFVRRQRIVGLDEFFALEPKALDEEAAQIGRASSIVLPGA
jgi:hypothetical protein